MTAEAHLAADDSAPRLVLATGNAGKAAEFRALLAGCGSTPKPRTGVLPG